MSDERLIRDLRALDRPVEPDPDFEGGLFSLLEQELGRPARPARPLIVLLAAALLVALTVGLTLAVGSGLIRLPWLVREVNPAPSGLAIEASATPGPSAIPSVTPPTGIVYYTTTACGGDWVTCLITEWRANSDGSGPREDVQSPIGWSADGSRLLFLEDQDLFVTDATGSEVARFGLPVWCGPDKNDLSRPAPCPQPENVLCTLPCGWPTDFALSPDGTRVAFVHRYLNENATENEVHTTVIALLDLGSGQVTDLTSTRTTNPQPDCLSFMTAVTTCQGDDANLDWSPDGRRIAFDRQGMSTDPPGAPGPSSALYVVDADGANLGRVTQTLDATKPSWSPGGTQLVFQSDTFVQNGDVLSDIYTIGIDGSGLSRLTEDGISALPTWQSGGRVAFERVSPVQEGWIMDSDGSNQARLSGSLAELAAAGCTTKCWYSDAEFRGQLDRAYFLPTP